MFCTTLLAVICVTATAAVKIVPEPAEVIDRAGKSSIPSEMTIAAPSGSNLADTYIDLTSKILESKGITLKKGGCCSTVKLKLSRWVKADGSYVIKV